MHTFLEGRREGDAITARFHARRTSRRRPDPRRPRRRRRVLGRRYHQPRAERLVRDRGARGADRDRGVQGAEPDEREPGEPDHARDGQALGDRAERGDSRVARPATRTARRTARTPVRLARPDDVRPARLVEARNNVHRLRRSSPIDGEQGSAIILALIVLTVIGTITAASLSYLRTSLAGTNIATRPARMSGSSADAAMETAIAYLRAPSRGRAQPRHHVPGVDDDVPRRRGNGHRRRLPASGIVGADQHPAGASS